MYNSKESFKNLKQVARTSLKGRWALAIVVTFLNIVLLMIPDLLNKEYKVGRLMNLMHQNRLFLDYDIYSYMNSIEVIRVSFFWRLFIWIVNLIFVGALSFGISRFFIKLVRRNSPRIEDLFEGFKILGTTILAHIVLSIFKFLWYSLATILIVFLGIVGTFVFNNQIYTEAQLATSILGFGALSLIIYVGISIFLNRYALTYYILSDNRGLEVMDSVNKSVELMKGNKIRLFLLYLSFIGWYVLGVISFGIGFIWILPYVEATIAEFYNSLLN